MRVAFLLSVIISLTAAATAEARTSATATPNRVGQASSVHFVVDGTAPPISSRIPSALVFTAPAGLKFNPVAAPKRCGTTSARLNECPSASQIGTGTLAITVFYQGHPPRDVTFTLHMYLHTVTTLFGIVNIVGTRVVPGSLSTTSGITVSFDPLPTPPAFQGVSYALRGITLNLGATRRVVQSVKYKRNGHVHFRRKTHVYSLIHNPSSCSGGAWGASVSLHFPTAPSVTLPTPIACSP